MRNKKVNNPQRTNVDYLRKMNFVGEEGSRSRRKSISKANAING